MKVLFVCSGNSKDGISPIVKAQGESLKKNGIGISYFTIKGKGIIGYLSNILPLRRMVKNNKFDIVHSHYSLSSYVTVFSSIGLNIPHIVSLMGCDVNKSILGRKLLRFFSFFYKAIIVKSDSMKEYLKLDNISVIPNGVKLMDQSIISSNKPTGKILWISDPNRPEKNFQLAQNAIDLVDHNDVSLKVVNGVEHTEIFNLMKKSDLLLLTSIREGSPNVIKEAMACNLPVVATDVGDIRWLFGNEPGHYITNFEPEDVANKIKLALAFKKEYGQTRGRERLLNLGLDSETVAKKIISIYREMTV
ncbi:MAG: glycosyltransferase family 4 protein [bacterium]